MLTTQTEERNSLGKEERLQSTRMVQRRCLVGIRNAKPNVRIAQKDQKSIRINPTRNCAFRIAAKRTSPGSSTFNRYSRPKALGAHRRLRRRSGISPLYD